MSGENLVERASNSLTREITVTDDGSDRAALAMRLLREGEVRFLKFERPLGYILYPPEIEINEGGKKESYRGHVALDVIHGLIGK